MTEIYVKFRCAHYGLYGNAPVLLSTRTAVGAGEVGHFHDTRSTILTERSACVKAATSHAELTAGPYSASVPDHHGVEMLQPATASVAAISSHRTMSAEHPGASAAEDCVSRRLPRYLHRQINIRIQRQEISESYGKTQSF